MAKEQGSYKYYKKGWKYGDRLLSSGFYEGQTYGALEKCWVGFVIAKEKLEWDKIEIYAKRIQNLRERSRNRDNRFF